MKTLKTKTIDGIEIVDGIGQLSICGIETRVAAVDTIAALPESVELIAKGKERDGHSQKAWIERRKESHFLKEEQLHKTKGEFSKAGLANSKAKEHKQNGIDLFGSANTCNAEMKEIGTRLRPKQKEILRGNPHFHEPGRNLLQKLDGENWPEYLSRSVDLETLYLSKGQNEQVKTDGVAIPDFRGAKYSKKVSGTWGFGTITALGVTIPTGSINDEDLTEAQKTEISVQVENERLAGLSPEDKTVEYNGRVSSLANEAQIMENSLKFAKDANYMQKAQAFYDAEFLKLNTKYGV